MRIQTDVHRLKYRRTKIVATLGPASEAPETIERLLDAGVDVVRLNMSHGTHEEHAVRYQRVREAADRLGRHVAVLADLCGPKIRVGKFPGGRVELETGAEVTVTVRDVEGSATLIPSQYAALAADVKPGDRVLLDDGNLELRVEGVEGTEIAAKVIAGGPLKDRKGMNLPGVAISTPSLTDKDKVDAAFALELGVDLLALSFVRRVEDVRELRAIIDAAGRQVGVVSKIEKPEALENIEAIVEASHGVMVARGDLGVELPPEQVPPAQEQIIALGRRLHTPVIVATQMLESMVDRPRPTRAEVSDVANAVRAGADAVMLSAETAAGSFPLEAVRMMDTVARQTESHQWSEGAFAGLAEGPADGVVPFTDAIARSTAQLSRDLRVRAIVVASSRSNSTVVMSASRPAAPLVALFASPADARRAALYWGVVPLQRDLPSVEDRMALARQITAELGLAESGQSILLVHGFDDDAQRTHPSITALRI